MRILALISLALVLTGGAAAQSPSDLCRPAAVERSVHEALLAYFQVFEGSVRVAAYEKRKSAEGYEVAVAAAVADFNARNAPVCAAANAAITDIPLIEGPQRTRLSRVGFSADGMTAFAEVTMIGGPETGSSHFVVLNRRESHWIVGEDQPYRIF